MRDCFDLWVFLENAFSIAMRRSELEGSGVPGLYEIHIGASGVGECIFSRKSGTGKIRDHNVDFPRIRPITAILQIYV